MREGEAGEGGVVVAPLFETDPQAGTLGCVGGTCSKSQMVLPLLHRLLFRLRWGHFLALLAFLAVGLLLLLLLVPTAVSPPLLIITQVVREAKLLGEVGCVLV